MYITPEKLSTSGMRKNHTSTLRRFHQESNIHTRDAPKNIIKLRVDKLFESKVAVDSAHKGNSGRPASATKTQPQESQIFHSSV